MTSTTIPDAIDQGTLDWAHSMQTRHAESLTGMLARQSDGEPMDAVYRDRILKAAVVSPTPPSTSVEKGSVERTKSVGPKVGQRICILANHLRYQALRA